MKRLYSAEEERGGDFAFQLVHDHASTIANAAREREITVELEATMFFVAGKKYTQAGGIPGRAETDYAAVIRVTVPQGASIVETRKLLYVALRRYLNTVNAKVMGK